MSDLFHKYLQLTLLRVTPQELPGHTLALWVSVVAAFLTSVAGLLFAYPVGDAIIRSILAIVVPGVLVYAFLGVKNLQPRFKQSYGALCGSAAIIYLVALPLLPAFFAATVESPSGKLVVVLVLLLDVWTVLVTAHILKHTFDIGFASGVSLAVVLMIVTLLTIEAIAPTQRTAKPEDVLSGGAETLYTVPSPSAVLMWHGLYRNSS